MSGVKHFVLGPPYLFTIQGLYLICSLKRCNQWEKLVMENERNLTRGGGRMSLLPTSPPPPAASSRSAQCLPICSRKTHKPPQMSVKSRNVQEVESGRQWRIQDFPEEGAPTPRWGRQLLFSPKIPENCMKMKEFGHFDPGGARPWRSPLDPPMGTHRCFSSAFTTAVKTHNAITHRPTFCTIDF